MRWLALFCFSASGAIFALPYGPAWMAPFLAAAAAGFLLYALYQKKRRRMVVLVLAAGVAFGVFYQTLYDFMWVDPVRPLEGTEQVVTVTLSDYAQAHTYGAKVTALLDVGAPRLVKVQLYGDETLLSCGPGDRVTTNASLRSAQMIHEKKVTSFTSKGMHLLLYAKGDLLIEPANGRTFLYSPLYFSQLLQEKIAQLYQGNARILMTALLTGDRTHFDDTLYSQLSETGVTHVTAVSGMHCAFLFGVVRLLVKSRRKAALIGMPLLFFFMLMVGAAPSVTRACFMIAILSAAPLLHRENDSLTTMSAALLLILMGNPYAAASIGLQLSFLSVAGILLFSNRIYGALSGKHRDGAAKRQSAVWRLVLSALSTTVSASLFTLPLVAYYFGCVSLISPLTNLLCLWAVSFSFYMGILSLLVGFVYLPVAAVLAIPASAALDYFMAVVRLFAQIPYHAVYTSNAYLPGWIFYVYLMLAAALLDKKRRLRTVVLTAVLSATTLGIVIALPVLANGRASMTASVLDVGQGESVLFVSGGASALVDCGSSNSWINAGSVAANQVNTLGQTELTYLILTHYHADHANGIETLLSRVSVKYLVIPEVHGAEERALQAEVLTAAEAYGIPTLRLTEETELSMGEAVLTLYPPLGAGSINEEGLSLLCSCQDFDMLVTGDMDSETEALLLQTADLPDLEVLVVGHHGSKYSSSVAFLEETAPEVAVISVGDNSYGHPAPETLQRLEEAGVEVRRTDRGGTISITVY